MTSLQSVLTADEYGEMVAWELMNIHTAYSGDWQTFLKTRLPSYFTSPFGKRHHELWEWVDSIEIGVKPENAFVAIWDRGSGKSTNAEAVCCYFGARGTRGYGWYVSETQDQADEHVGNVASMLESSSMERHHTALSSRHVNKYGSSKGWRRNRLRTASGLTIDSLGLDTARRGFKVEESRPDFMIFDDIDGELDTPERVDKKIAVITKKLLPAGSIDCAVLFCQNLVIPHGVIAQLYDGSAKFLANRIISGPYPSVYDLETENIDGRDVITGGTASWVGKPLETCQAQIDEWGLQAFLEECQHEVYGRSGQMFLPEWWDVKTGRNRYHVDDRGVVNQTIARFQFWDTALKDKAHNDPSMCITIDLLPTYNIALRDVWTDRLESAYLPDKMRELAARWNRDNKLAAVVVEDKGGGTTSIQTIRRSAPEWLADITQEFTPTGSKDYRAKTASMWCPRDCILFPYPDASLSWYSDLLDSQTGQLFRFAGEGTVPHDEFIDCISMAILYLEHFISEGFYARVAGQKAHERQRDNGDMSRVQQALMEAGY